MNSRHSPAVASCGNGHVWPESVQSPEFEAFVRPFAVEVIALQIPAMQRIEKFYHRQASLRYRSSPSARPLKYPHRGEPFDQQAHIDPCRLIIAPSGTEPASAPRNALSGGISRQVRPLLHFRRSGNTGQTWANVPKSA